MTAPEIRLRTTSAELISLPWERPLEQWSMPEVPLRDVAVGPSRHLVKFVEADGRLWALKSLDPRLAVKEYTALQKMESMSLPAVRPAGVVRQTQESAILVTSYLESSWQYRRLFMRLPPGQSQHRARLLDAMAGLLVELHRHGVFWGDCSLANTLFSRDGQVLQAWLVDAETSEVHQHLSDGQRSLDLEILTENVALGMIDLAVRLERPAELHSELIAEARGIADRYTALWDLLHAEPTFDFNDRYRVESTVRKLNALGFAVDEVALQPVSSEDLRLSVRVGDRRFHAAHLRDLTGLDVGEGQAMVLLGDLRAYHGYVRQQSGFDVSESDAALQWVTNVLKPGMASAHEVVGNVGSPIQAYCDLLEVRWLLSEMAGHDVGSDAALAALRIQGVPRDAAATMGVAEMATGQFPAVDVEDERIERA
jgi:tRNA A-37 threonylcarbamoyl transferase component Bud32